MIRRAALRAFALPLARPLATAHGVVERRSGLLIELEDAAGLRGFGEVTPLPDFGGEALPEARRSLEQALAVRLEARAGEGGIGASDGVGATVHPHGIDPTPCATAALDAAEADLSARRAGDSLAGWLHRRAGTPGAPASRVAVQALVAGGTPEEVDENAGRALVAGFRAFKLKLAVDRNAPGLGVDLDRVAALRGRVGQAARIRLDANEAWRGEEALRALDRLAPFAIDFVEQPVDRADVDGLQRLAREAAIPVAADEAMQGALAAACLSEGGPPVLIVKPALLGGALGALSIAVRARETGPRVVFSTFLDGAVGRALPLALAAAVGAGDEVHGLGTGRLLTRDLGPAERLDAGGFEVGQGAGIGFTPSGPDLESTPVFEVSR